MSGEEAEKKRSEEVVYQKIEEALLAMPEVSHFTADGFQFALRFFQLTHGFGGIRLQFREFDRSVEIIPAQRGQHLRGGHLVSVTACGLRLLHALKKVGVPRSTRLFTSVPRGRILIKRG